MKRTIELLRDVLDHDIVDVDGVRCGMVDDIELAPSGVDATPVVAALLVGPGAWQARLPALVAVAAAWLFGRARTRVPWSEVAELTQSVKLKRRASELGLGVIERKAATWLKRFPGS
jgi:sporulation protein YlmC with PRC-barrel domain